MIYAATTLTGAIYVLDMEQKIWSKVRKHEDRYYLEGGPAKIGRMMTGTVLTYPSQFPPGTWADSALPEVGKHLYVTDGSMSGWWVSTEVQSIVILESFDHKNITDESLAGTPYLTT